MPTFTETIMVAADPDTAWRVLGDLAAVDRWIPGITKVELDGMARVCTSADGHTQHEAILDYLPAARSYRYTVDGGLPVAYNRGRFLVEPAGNGAGNKRVKGSDEQANRTRGRIIAQIQRR